jgi:replication factor C large subunit
VAEAARGYRLPSVLSDVPSLVPADRRPLTERWRPSRLSEVVGNRRAVDELAAWADAWETPVVPSRRAVVLVGPAGVGKTSAAIAVASERGWTVVEMNASEARNQTAIERVAGRASITHSLDAPLASRARRRTLVLLDEADCLSGGRTTEGSRPVRAREPVALRAFLEGRYGSIGALNDAWGLGVGGKLRPFESWASVPKSPGNFGWARLPAARRDLDDWKEAGRPEETGDRGGLGAIARIVRSTRQPVVLTVNDDRPLHRYSPVFRTSARTIRFGPVGAGEVADRLRAVADREGFALGAGVLESIVARARGDLRAALNDLEAVAPLPPGPGQQELLGTRDRASDFAALTEEVLSRPRYYRAVEVRDRLDATPDDLLPWIDENVPWFAPDEAHRDAGLAVVATAELFLTRARRWRTYGLWGYATELLTGGVSLALRERPASGSGRAAFPQFLGEMGRSRTSRGVRDALASKLGRRLHLSRSKSRAVALPFVEALFGMVGSGRRDSEARAVARALARELELTAEELAGLLGSPPDSDAVREFLGTSEGSEETTAAAEGTVRSTSPAPRPGGPGSRPGVQRRLGE